MTMNGGGVGGGITTAALNNSVKHVMKSWKLVYTQHNFPIWIKLRENGELSTLLSQLLDFNVLFSIFLHSHRRITKFVCLSDSL